MRIPDANQLRPWTISLALLALAPVGRGQADTARAWLGFSDALIEQDDIAGARAQLDSLARTAEVKGDLAFVVGMMTSRLWRYEGRPTDAYHHLDSLRSKGRPTDPFIDAALDQEEVRVLKALGLYQRASLAADPMVVKAIGTGDPRTVVKALILRAELERRMAEYKGMLRDLIEAEKRLDAVEYPFGRCNLAINWGNFHFFQEHFAEARVRYREAYDIASEHGFHGLVSNAVYNIASCTGEIEGTGAALNYYDEVLRGALGPGQEALRVEVLASMGRLLNAEDRYGEAKGRLLHALALATEMGDSLTIVEELQYLATSYDGLGRPDSALALTLKAVSIAQGQGQLDVECRSEYKVCGYLKRMGRSSDALDHLERYTLLSDSLAQVKNSEAVNRLQIEFDTDKKEQTIRLQGLELERAQALKHAADMQRNILVGTVVTLLALGFLAYRNMRQKQTLAEQARQLGEQRVERVLRDQELRVVNAAMEGQERERSRIAHDLHDRVGSLLSAVKMQFGALEGRMEKAQATAGEQYQKVTDLLDTAVGEVRRISHDMEHGTLAAFGLEAALGDLRDAVEVPGRLQVELNTFGLTDRMEKRLEIAAYRMVQEAVSNALKHAKAGHLSIQVTRAEGLLNIVVEDDGTGYDPARANDGMGMSNLRSRAAEFNGTVEVDTRIGRGTTVVIDLPLSGGTP